MKLIKQNAQYVKQAPTIIGAFKLVEQAGRTCYSKDTEILTENGFINIQEISPEDKVLTYNRNSNQLEYQKSNMIKKEFSGKMISINHANVKFCVTPDHRMLVSNVKDRNYDFLQAKYLFGIKGSKQSQFRIPKYFNNATINNQDYFDELTYSKLVKNGFLEPEIRTTKYTINDDFLILLGAYITEGHSRHGEEYDSGSCLYITQSEKNSLYNDIIEALNNLNISYCVQSDPRKPEIKWIRWGNSVDVAAFDEWFGRYAKNKHLPDWFRKLSARQLDLLLSTMYKGDGSYNTTRNERYLSISPVLLNQVQEIWILLGKNATVSYDSEFSQKCYTEQNLRDSWIISKDQLQEIEYNDFVYCPSTDNGIVCIRYKNKTMWCGNCYKSEFRTTDNSWLDFVTMLKTRKHYSPMEFGTIYLTIDVGNPLSNPEYLKMIQIANFYSKNKYSKTKIQSNKNNTGQIYYITTNLRVIFENDRIDDLQFACEPTLHEQRICVKLITSRDILAEYTRHRTMSFCAESTRYVGYSIKQPLSEYDCDSNDEICKAYLSGFSMKQIANNSSYTESQIRNILKKNNIEIRGLNNKGNRIEDYFSIIDTPEKAYLLGIIQTNGSVRETAKSTSLSIIQHKDYSWFIEDMLLDFSDYVGKSEDKNCTQLQIGSKQIVHDLISLGIVPNKIKLQTDENISVLWNSIPNEYKPDFIRGLIDGDGHVTYFTQKSAKNESCNIGLCSVKEKLIDLIIQYIQDNFDYTCEKDIDKNVFKLCITDFNKSIEIGKALYKNFKYPFGHPKKAAAWIKRLGLNFPIADYKDSKFTIIEPSWLKTSDPKQIFCFVNAIDSSEDAYVKLRMSGWKPQQARQVLPNALKVELMMCGFESDWQHFFDLRMGTGAHPTARELATMIATEFKENNVGTNINFK